MSEKVPSVVNDKGIFKPTSVKGGLQYAQVLIDSKAVPDRYNTKEEVFTAIQMAMELNLPPLTALRQIGNVKGTPSLFGDLPMAVVQRSGQLEMLEEFLLDSDGNRICYENKNLNNEPFGAVCRVKRKGVEGVCERYFSLDLKKKASISVFQHYPRIGFPGKSRDTCLFL